MDSRLVRVVCTSCDANYRISAEDVRGKVIDYCCSNCGAVIEVNGTAIELVAPTRPGQDPRDLLPRTPSPAEVDVSTGAFRVNPPPSRSDTPAGLVRIKPPPPPSTEAFSAHRSTVQSSMPPPMSMPSRESIEAQRPSISPSEFPPAVPPPVAEERQSSKKGLWIMGTLAAAAVVGLIGRTVGSTNTESTAAAAAQGVEQPSPVTTRLQASDFRGTTTEPSQAPGTAVINPNTPPAKVAPGTEVSVESLKPEKRKKKIKKGGALEGSDPIAEESAPAEPETTPVATFVAPEPPPPPGPEFNKDSAQSALEDAAALAATCRDAETTAGAVRVAVTFVPSGQVTVAVVESGPIRGTPVGSCVASKFRTAKVPPFSGPKVTVHKTMNF
ncbi:MAG: hypothetical protein ABW133_06945 [Polyangiaceae bacterium]